MKNIIFIINPISGVGRQNNIERLIQEELNLSISYQIEKTTHENHAFEIAASYADKVDAIIAIGGDGTVQEIGRALINSKTAMGIIPTGSGNGFARSLQIPQDIRQSIRVFNNCKLKKTDTLSINGNPGMGIMGIGFDAHIASCFTNYGTRGFLTYSKLVLKEFFTQSNFKIEIEIDGTNYREEVFILNIANSGQYGNGAMICPLSELDDGILEACFLKKPVFYQLPLFILRLFTGNLHRSPLLKIIKGKEFVIKNNKFKYHCDGEVKNPESTLIIKPNPLSLNIIIPDYGKKE